MLSPCFHGIAHLLSEPKANPMLEITLLKGKNSDGFHTWTDEEITRFEKRWPIGTRERLALDLLLYTGLARGDVVPLGKQLPTASSLFACKRTVATALCIHRCCQSLPRPLRLQRQVILHFL
jgi:hypothetical protein